MKIAITGATGFIGRHVLKYLLEHTPHQVLVLVRSPDNIHILPAAPDRIKIIFGDIQKGEPNWMQTLNYPDKLIHLAWAGLPNYKQWFHLHTNLPYDLRFLINLSENGLKDITITGTCFEYGIQEGCLSETLLTDPGNPYAIAKDNLRRAMHLLANEYGINYKWLRLFYMHGPGQNPGALIPQLLQAIENGDDSFNMSGGEQIRDYMPVEEMAAAIAGAALQEEISGVINCCSGNGIKVIDLVRQILADSGSGMALNPGFYPYPEHEPFAFWGDNSKLKHALRAYQGKVSVL